VLQPKMALMRKGLTQSYTEEAQRDTEEGL
jgi:hypothetical protein